MINLTGTPSYDFHENPTSVGQDKEKAGYSTRCIQTNAITEA
jgi:hypothetical protein